MLPPFVPPSARVPSESLPLITEFVIDRGAHTTMSMSSQAVATPPRAWTTDDETELPSIDEFLMERASGEQQTEEAEPTVQAQAEPPAETQTQAAAEAAEPPVEAGPRPEDQPASGIAPQVLEREEGEPIPRADTVLMPTPVSPDASEVKESTPPGARFNDEAADAEAEAPGITMSEAWEASAVSPATAGEEAVERSESAGHPESEHDEWGESPSEGAGQTSAQSAATQDAAWVAEERDSFDWNSVGHIATGPDAARRAEEAWSGTEWEPQRKPEHEQVATALVQLARRVRAGEVKVELPANATVEASLAALLAALLADEER